MIEIAWYWYSDRQGDQWNRIKDPEMNAYNYVHLIFDKGAKTIQCEKDSNFNKWCWLNWQSACTPACQKRAQDFAIGSCELPCGG